LLEDLSRSTQTVLEVLIVDSSDDKLKAPDLLAFTGLRIRYFEAAKSVCAQRNMGIREAQGDWIFLCDDDIEVPSDYLSKLLEHLGKYPAAGAVSGLCLEWQNGQWESQQPVTSARSLLWRYLFQLSIWGEIRPRGPGVDWIVARYRRRGNHISSAGWPVITDLSAPFFRTPTYLLGASLVKREWPTDVGPVDLMCRDEEGAWVAVEIKRIGTIEAVEQLTRYLGFIREDPAKSACRGILAAQKLKPQAVALAESRGIRCVEVDLALLRGEREPDLTLFTA